jgi:ATP synthase protein I
MVRAVDKPVGRPTIPWANNFMSSSGEDRDPGRGELSAQEREAFKRRATELGARLDRVRAEMARDARPTPDERTRGAAFGQAAKIAIELVVGILVGGFIGRVIDGQLGTQPWFMIVFLFLGFAAGLANVIRTARRLQAEAEPLQRSARPTHGDENED